MIRLQNWLVPVSVVFLSISGSSYFSFMLYQDYFNYDVEYGSHELAGRIVEVEKTVKRKLSDRFIFDSVSSEAKLFWNDTIQTSAASKVKIELKNGEKITLGENALVVLEKNSAGLALKLKSGELFIEGGDKDVTVNGVKVDKNSKDGISLKLNEKDGQLITEAQKIAKEKAEAAAQAKAEEEKRKIAAIEAKMNIQPPTALLPAEGDSIDLSRQKLELRWKTVENAVGYRIRLYTKIRSKTVMLQEQQTKGASQFVLLDLDDGSYFWKVESINERGDAFSSHEIEFKIRHSKVLDAPELEIQEVQ